MKEIIETPNSMVQALESAQIDQQIATAHRYPRKMTQVHQNILSLVSISKQAAEECSYALPRGNKPITGPSIRLAEIVVNQWGNCRVGARVVHVDRVEKYVEAEGVFHDLETNTAVTARVRRRISDRNGKLFNDDMIIVTGNAACAIAKRNAILSGVPKAIWHDAYEYAQKTIRGDAKTLPERIDGAMKAMAAFGLAEEDVFRLVGVGGRRDITLEHISLLTGMYNALRSEETTVEELMATSAGRDDDDRPEDGSITSKPRRKAAKKEKAVKAAPETAGEPDQNAAGPEGAGHDAPQPQGATQDASGPDPARFEDLADTIINDLLDAADPNDVFELYEDQIIQMEGIAPAAYERVMKEIEAARVGFSGEG